MTLCHEAKRARLTGLIHEYHEHPYRGLSWSARGAREIVFDADDGSLAFGVNGLPPQRVPDVLLPGESVLDDSDDEDEAAWPFRFPPGAKLRPWLLLQMPEDAVSVGNYFHV